MGIDKHGESHRPRPRLHLEQVPSESSSDLIGRQVLDELHQHDVAGDVVRVVYHDVRSAVPAFSFSVEPRFALLRFGYSAEVRMLCEEGTHPVPSPRMPRVVLARGASQC